MWTTCDARLFTSHMHFPIMMCEAFPERPPARLRFIYGTVQYIPGIRYPFYISSLAPGLLEKTPDQTPVGTAGDHKELAPKLWRSPTGGNVFPRLEHRSVLLGLFATFNSRPLWSRFRSLGEGSFRYVVYLKNVQRGLQFGIASASEKLNPHPTTTS